MPTPDRILEGLAAIANEQTWLAVVWHIVLAGVIVALLAGWRPGKKLGATAVVLPLLSVAAQAAMARNLFNAVVFFLFAILFLAVLGRGLPPGRIAPMPAWGRVAGGLLIAFGWIYPHFLKGASALTYLLAAPVGLISCPTLSVLVGFTLLAAGFSSRAFSLALGILGMFYGAFGAFRLEVTIDLVLLAGSVTLIVFAMTIKFVSESSNVSRG